MEAEDLAKQLMMAFRSMSKHHTRYHAHADTKRSEMAILTLLETYKKENGLKITDISNKLDLPPSAITPVINTLEEKGLIIRKNAPADRRIVLVELTEKGLEFFEKKHAFFYHKAVQLCNYLGENDTREFIRIFKRASEFMNSFAEENECGNQPDNNIQPAGQTGADNNFIKKER